MNIDKTRDINQITRYLTNTFRTITANMEPAARTKNGANALYKLQCDFAWLIHEITMSPACIVQKHISDCNEFLDQLVQKHK